MIIPTLYDYINNVTAEKTNSGMDNQSKSTAGLVSVNTDTADRSVKGSYNPKDNRIFYSSNDPIYNIPIITISDSEVSDTGNTGYSNPKTFSPTATQSDSGTYEDRESSGIDLTSIIVPVAGIAGVAALAYLILGNDDVKKAVEKKVGGKKNE